MAQSDAIDSDAVEEQIHELEERLRGNDNENESRQDITNTISIDTDCVPSDLEHQICDIDGDINMTSAAALSPEHVDNNSTSLAAANDSRPSQAATHDSDYSDDEYEQKYREHADSR